MVKETGPAKATPDEQFAIANKLRQVMYVANKKIVYKMILEGELECWNDMIVAAWVAEKLHGKNKIFSRLGPILSRVEHIRRNLSIKALEIEYVYED